MKTKERKNPIPPSPVTVIKVPGTGRASIHKGAARLLDSLGGVEGIVPAHAKRILIKPNLMTGQPWETGITVNPDLIEVIVTACRDCGLEIMVGEGAGWGCDSLEAFNATGVSELCRKLDVPLIDFKRGRGVRVPVPHGELLRDVLVDEIFGGVLVPQSF